MCTLTVFVPSFLVTATEASYAVVMNGSVTGEPDGVNITEYGLTLVTNGTACDPTVSGVCGWDWSGVGV